MQRAIWESLGDGEKNVVLGGIPLGLPALVALSRRLAKKGRGFFVARLAGAAAGVAAQASLAPPHRRPRARAQGQHGRTAAAEIEAFLTGDAR